MSRHPNSRAGAPLDAETIQRRLDAIKHHGGNVMAAARDLGLPRPTLQTFWRKHKDRAPPAKLLEVGYDLTARERTPKEAWDAHAGVAERKIASALDSRWRVIQRPRGPFAIFHSTDEHLDDDATPLRLIEADIACAHNLGAVMCHGGDLLNNWPLAGKLAKQWAEQSCTLPDSLLRAQHFIEIFRPDVWTDGNHEEMNPYLMQMLHGWLPDTCLSGYWSVQFIVDTPGGREVRCSLSHKFQKGSSWFHPHHGVLREMMETPEADVYMEGHIHVAGAMYRTLPERGFNALAVASAGYKVVDKYAARISRGGTLPKIKGRAHWIVCDPQADEDAHLAVAFDCPSQAEAYLNGLQNLRAV